MLSGITQGLDAVAEITQRSQDIGSPESRGVIVGDNILPNAGNWLDSWVWPIGIGVLVLGVVMIGDKGPRKYGR